MTGVQTCALPIYALLKQGARQDAVAAATEVLPAIEGGVTSMRCLNRLRLVRQAAGNTAGAEEFCERFDAVERALAASCSLPHDDAPDASADVPALWHGTSPGHHVASAGEPTLRCAWNRHVVAIARRMV